jgi:hypothetical protein
MREHSAKPFGDNLRRSALQQSVAKATQHIVLPPVPGLGVGDNGGPVCQAGSGGCVRRRRYQRENTMQAGLPTRTRRRVAASRPLRPIR